MTEGSASLFERLFGRIEKRESSRKEIAIETNVRAFLSRQGNVGES